MEDEKKKICKMKFKENQKELSPSKEKDESQFDLVDEYQNLVKEKTELIHFLSSEVQRYQKRTKEIEKEKRENEEFFLSTIKEISSATGNNKNKLNKTIQENNRIKKVFESFINKNLDLVHNLYAKEKEIKLMQDKMKPRTLCRKIKTFFWIFIITLVLFQGFHWFVIDSIQDKCMIEQKKNENLLFTIDHHQKKIEELSRMQNEIEENISSIINESMEKEKTIEEYGKFKECIESNVWEKIPHTMNEGSTMHQLYLSIKTCNKKIATIPS